MATMSGLARTEICVASEVLERTETAGSIYARHGTAVHGYLECIAQGMSRERALALVVSAHREACAALDLDLLPHSQPGAWRAEVAMAYDWAADTARVLDAAGRAYGELGETEVAGTTDLVGLHADGETVVILDPKTGWKHLGAPSESLQLLSYAVAAARAFGRTKAQVGFIFLREGQEPRLVVEDVSEAQLEEAAERIRAIMERAYLAKAGALPVVPVKGEHCDYCPAIQRCPAHVSMLAPFLFGSADVARGALVGDPGPVVSLRPDQVAQALEAAKQVVDMGERMVADLQQLIRALPAGSVVDARTGKVAVEVLVEVERLDPGLARPVLDELFGADLAHFAIETKTTLSKAAVERLVDQKRAVTKEKKKDMMVEVLGRIRAAGGISTTSYSKIAMMKPALPAKE